MRTMRWTPLLMLGMLIGLCGCGDSGGGIAVRGKVTFDGKPVEDGVILFIPEGASNSGADSYRPKVGTQILNGEYAMEADRGPQTGTYQVSITWEQKTGRKIPSGDLIPKEETKQILPERYNTKTTLKATISLSDNVHNFDLKSK
ncbi:hypothetical protein [Tuwongella immobilis]|uniref:Carboxypeptidase regulatory-like domain-containing protein n=1 Tax=Tuwongella immobilis TaxID=692036 RepID=A0A6C2YTA9_9BACT|nr:hypothetical protein [Tuwongella immobilis]VIP04644.1 Uncharacterized protein OS=Planctomyces brasiliensis (strain ATCC 49424 / DSM 5305 / JCM 21570 / NBRC 103401 / IFAM 1448) GN=Plabr_0147 PE=4 SV=1 [Tuwongella immobilis]VTS06649.1 Uncharacterized protein OS=Planctomyces brasiliensis (strain ATCC 49424 / DSM 5305 / JCM 21570 / NBRC 103401 / IFAM 1448) GN=Plabr_0147 PE=4 SV=1 [Tuwongella immobilis]